MSDEIEEVSAEEAPVQEAAPEQSPEPAPEPASPNYWGAIRNMPEFQGRDEREVAHSLYTAVRREKAAADQLARYREVMPYAQEYMQNKSSYEAWQKAQAQAQQQEEPQPAPWWNPPEIKDSYRRWITRDENGREQIHPDAPYEARNALQERQHYTEDFARRFLEDPQSTLAPMVESLAQQKANELIEERVSKERNEGFVARVTEENRDWLFYPGTENPTPEGIQVHNFIEEAVQKGITDPEDRWDYAKTKLENQLAMQRLAHFEQQQQLPQQPQQPQPPQPPVPKTPEPPAATQAQTNMDYLRREAARRPSRGVASAASGEVRRGSRSFEDMLRDAASDRGLL